jgi:uncharacterized protein YjbJ (UPF0337 family)
MQVQKLQLMHPWQEVKEMIKEIVPFLTDEDLDFEEGQEDKLLQRLAEKMETDKESIRKWIESVSVNEGKAS